MYHLNSPHTQFIPTHYHSNPPFHSAIPSMANNLFRNSHSDEFMYSAQASPMRESYFNYQLDSSVDSGYAMEDPFSAEDDATFCPISLAKLADDHGVAEDEMKRLVNPVTSPDFLSHTPTRTPSPFRYQPGGIGEVRPRTSSTSSSLSTGSDSGYRSPNAIKIIDPSTRQTVDLRHTAARLRLLK